MVSLHGVVRHRTLDHSIFVHSLRMARNMLPIHGELRGRTTMNHDAGRLAYQLDFLESELSRMGDAASDAERDLRRNPTDQLARDRLSAIYDLARNVWRSIQELRGELQASPG
jgi:hypothetical protein